MVAMPKIPKIVMVLRHVSHEERDVVLAKSQEGHVIVIHYRIDERHEELFCVTRFSADDKCFVEDEIGVRVAAGHVMAIVRAAEAACRGSVEVIVQ